MTRRRLDELVAPGALRCEYQPVFETTGAAPSLRAWEGLTRGPADTNLEAPDVLFEYARRIRAEDLIDRVCVALCMAGFSPLAGTGKLSLNVHASTLALDRGFTAFLQRTADLYGLKLDELTLEVVEHAPAWDVAAFSASLAELRRCGLQIALDDVGLGYANFRMFLEVSPDWLKLDRYLICGIEADARRRAIVSSLRLLGEACGATLVAEGVERREELAVLERLGVRLVQGFLFGGPRSASDWAAAVDAPGSSRTRPSAGRPSSRKASVPCG